MKKGTGTGQGCEGGRECVGRRRRGTPRLAPCKLEKEKGKKKKPRGGLGWEVGGENRVSGAGVLNAF